MPVARCYKDILFWTEKGDPVSALVFQARPIVMMPSCAEKISPETMRLYHLHRRRENIAPGLSLVFLSTAGKPDNLRRLMGHLKNCAGKDVLSRDDHVTIGRYLGFGTTTIDLLIQNSVPASRPKVWQYEFRL